MTMILTERMKTDLLTCYDIVASGRYPYTGKLGILTPEDEKKVDDAIAAVNATELGPRDFNAISDGQRQRILLARAICQDPELIILDEPTSFLDIKYKLELLSILRNMAKMKGITVITSLHEIDLAMKIADKVICVKGDHIYKYGAPDEIFDEGMIRELYDIDNGFFDTLYGSIELPAPTGQGWQRHMYEESLGRKHRGKESRPEGAPYAFVISSGGGGIPVIEKMDGHLEGVAAVIDKDFAAELLAEQVEADTLLILTEVEKVAINFNKPDQKDLDHLTLIEATKYIEEGQFPAGSMLPKVEAGMKFVRMFPNKRAIITSLDKAVEALNGETGTVITFN